MSFKISKTTSFDYSHRVWTQNLDDTAASGAAPKCLHVHGHTGRVTITLHSDTLDESTGMVLDYTEMNFLFDMIKEAFDHKHVIDIMDPATDMMFPLLKNNNIGDVLKLNQKSQTSSNSNINPMYKPGDIRRYVNTNTDAGAGQGEGHSCATQPITNNPIMLLKPVDTIKGNKQITRDVYTFLEEPLEDLIKSNVRSEQRVTNWGFYKIDVLDPEHNTNPIIKQIYEGVTLVNFIPTSENFARCIEVLAASYIMEMSLLCDDPQKFGRIKSIEVQFSETPNSIASSTQDLDWYGFHKYKKMMDLKSRDPKCFELGSGSFNIYKSSTSSNGASTTSVTPPPQWDTTPPLLRTSSPFAASDWLTTKTKACKCRLAGYHDDESTSSKPTKNKHLNS